MPKQQKIQTLNWSSLVLDALMEASLTERDIYKLASDFNFNEDGTVNEVGNTTIIPFSVVKKVIKIIVE